MMLKENKIMDLSNDRATSFVRALRTDELHTHRQGFPLTSAWLSALPVELAPLTYKSQSDQHRSPGRGLAPQQSGG